jgi:cellulose synthase operon protein C
MKNPSSIRPCSAAILLVAAGFVLCAQTLRAEPADPPTQSLLDKAHDLEVQGHLDVAAQTWQQVLLADPKNTDALAGLARSARLSGNPALANIYLERLHSIKPDDTNIARVTEALPKQAVTTTHTVVHPVLEQEAYKALNARNLPGAETRFKAMLAADSENAQALAGMGYVRMQQSNYDGAISFLEQAKLNGAQDSALDSALETAHFDQLMSQGSDAFKENDLPTAEQRYRAAVAIRSDNTEALTGLHATLLKAQPQAAIRTAASVASTAPAAIDIQNASLLFNTGDDAGLYRQLILLGDRSDLSDEQRSTIQTIWTNWALRRANQAAASGDKKRSLAILIAAARSTPEDTVVIRALASGCARSELPVQAVILFKSQDMTTATLSDYRSAVGAALAAEDDEDAETWLHSGLEKYPKDPEMLFLAGKFERTRDNDIRAAGYFRATLAALPPGDPVAEVVAELSQPHPANHPATPTQQKELATLLSTPDSADGKSQAAEPAKLSLPSQSNSANAQAQLQTPQQPVSSQPLTTQPQGVYGSYVPYVAPKQISDNGSRNLPRQPESSDALPTARYMPNAQTAPNVAHLDLSSAPLSGQNDPLAEDDSLATRNAQFTSRHHVSLSSGISHGQQYPQPEIQPQATTGAAAHHLSSPTTSAPTQSSITQPLGAQPLTTEASSAPPSAPMSDANAAQPNAAQPNLAQPTTALGSPLVVPATPNAAPPTDAEVIARGEPALRGLYDPNEPAGGQPPLSLRAQTQMELNALEGSYSGWLGGTGYARYRTGTSGFDRLTDFESPFEVSAVVGKAARVTIVTRPISLNNGALDNTYFQNSGGTIPILGTLPANALVAPPRQNASGIGGELQLTSRNYALGLGFTPYDFLVGNVIGRGQFRTFKGRLTFYGERDSVKDTQLSYAGMRDPGSATPFSTGNIWGGVVSTGGGVRLDIGGPRSRLYVSGDAADLTGTHVLENTRYGGQMGASFRVHQWPDHGALNVGGNFVGMHYEHNEQSMTYGQGGYFSPNVYFLASVPVTYTGYYKSNLHYSIAGAAGVQSFQQDKAPYFPLDVPLQTDFNNPFTPATSNTSLSYSFNSEGAYLFNQHWFVGAFLAANNTNNYNNFSGGFFVRYLFKSQYTIEDYPTGMFPAAGMRPLRVP